MWTFVALAGCLIGLVLVLRQAVGLRDLPTRALLVIIWLRYALQAFPDISTPSKYAGFSLNALTAVGSAGLLIVLVDTRLFRLRPLLPIYAFIGFTIFSGVLNREVVGIVNDVTKWAYMLGVALLVYRATGLFGFDRTLKALLATFATPVVLQVASIALNNPKSADGAVSYIGGYFHESMFSQILFSFLCVASLIVWRRQITGGVLAVVAIVGLIFANYRTTIIATLPMAALLFASQLMSLTRPKTRVALALVLVAAVIVATPTVLQTVPERYHDLFAIGDRIEALSDSPELLNREERRVLSGRIYVWAGYITAWRDAPAIEQAIGHGPNAWEGRFRLYAHNTFVSALYEFGVVGLVGLLLLFAYNLGLTLLIPDRGLATRLFAGQLGFLILNLSTMPLWSIEGRIIYGILLACTWAAVWIPISEATEAPPEPLPLEPGVEPLLRRT